MLIIRPSWLGHFAENDSRQAIYSLDVSSDGHRLVSGGLDGKVRIWDVAKCIGVSEESDEIGLLATMPAHTGSVLCVRFSPNGRWLASGSDDKLLIIWEREEGAPSQQKSFGEVENVKEVWKVYRRLVGHQGDIMDLAWSHDSALLVSTGVDSSIIIWSGTTFEKKKELTAHASSVKGITFDPAGKYFATASDDRTIKIWRTADFVCEETISAPFKNSPISTYFRRPSWSPDGNCIAAANAMNGLVPAISIISRGTWDSEINLIGHEGAVEVAKFNPVLFMQDGSPISIVACAGLDRVLSIWNTVQARPITTSADIAEQGISDLAWTPDGLGLFICSFDGTLTVLRFEESEFGQKLGPDANEEALSKYGAGRHGAIMPESVEQLQLEDLSRKNAEESKKGRIADLMGPATNMPNQVASGLKEPSPALIPTTGNDSNGAAEELVPPPVNGQEKATVEITPLVSRVVAQDINTIPITASPVAPKAFVQKVTMVNGKKRIQPQLLSSGASQPPAYSRPSAVNATSTHTLDISQPSQALPRGGIPSLIIGNKRSAEDQLDDGPLQKRQFSEGATEQPPEFMRPAIVAPVTTVSQVRLGTPQVKSFISHNHASGIPYVLEARNPENSHDPVRLTLMKGQKIEWTDYIRSAVVLIVGTDTFVAVGCEDGGVIIWTPSGRRYMPEIVVDAVPVFLEARDDTLMVITSIGMLHVWELKKHTAPFAPVSLAPILDSATTIVDKLRRSSSVTQASITSKCVPVITLSNGDGYIYHGNLLCWVKVSEGWWAISSSYWDASGMTSSSRPTGIVTAIERRTNDEVMRQGRGRILSRVVKQALMKEGFEGLETAVSIGHLENRLSASRMLESADEYRSFLLMYAEKIAEEGRCARVEELCRELIGPTYIGSQTLSSWEQEVLGFDKRDLLREALARMGRFRAVQRICTEYQTLLNNVTSK